MAEEKFKCRTEKDTMGEVRLPEDTYYGAQTQRAVENFPVSGIRFPGALIRALGLIKKYAAQVNLDLGLLDARLARPVIAAADEVASGKMDGQFVVDVYQTGSGTSTNMNANEVIATRANEILTGRRSTTAPVHPNDHVNMGQSSNDVIPTAIHIAARTSIAERLVPGLRLLHESLAGRSEAFSGIVKAGRTHFQDAVPIRLGQEFGGYAHQVKLGLQRVEGVSGSLSELAMGGTALGTGLNTHREFAQRVIDLISLETGYRFKEAENRFEAQAAQDAAVETSGALKTVAVSLIKIANDIRLLSSGPRCGLAEINIPALQPGSSIMPGKVNPVIAESVIQVAAQVIGNDVAITMGGQGGSLDLNVMLPLIAHNLLQSIHILASAAKILAQKCVDGITANEKHCRDLAEKSLAICTALAPAVGYEIAAGIAKRAHKTGKTVLQVAMEEKALPAQELKDLLDPFKMT